MKRPVLIVMSLLGALAIASPASAGTKQLCTGSAQLTTHCTTVTDQHYRGGGYHPTLVPITACLQREEFRSITLQNGTSAWETGFYYGHGMPEVVTTVRNVQCWTHQQGHPGAYVVAFVCCSNYCGWVGGRIPETGKLTLRPMALPAKDDPMAKYRTPHGYDSSHILVH